MSLPQVLSLLKQEYGLHRWHTNTDPLSVLVLTVLSQNTSDANSGRAFAQLLASFGNWEAVANASVEDIAAAIKSGGLARVKAERISSALREVARRRGSLDLEFLHGLPLSEARAWLRQLPGVGPKTAACVLLFGLGRPALPVDTHIFRVARRLGLINSRVSLEKAAELLETLVPPEDIYQFHILLIEQGRRVCHARNPHCSECILRPLCPSSLNKERLLAMGLKGAKPLSGNSFPPPFTPSQILDLAGNPGAPHEIQDFVG